jgi:hypothetical protein
MNISVSVRHASPIFGAACAIALAVDTSPAQHSPLPNVPPIKIELVGPVSIPMRVFDQTRPGIEVMINGRGPFLFAVETGGPFGVILDAKVADALTLKPPSGGSDPLRSIESLQIGPLALRNVTAFVRDGTGLIGVDGMLGLSTFKELVLTVDYPRHQIRLEPDSLPAPNGRDIVPLIRTGMGGMLVGVQSDFAGRPVKLVIDTQGGTTVMCGPDAAEEFSFATPAVVAGQASIGGANGPGVAVTSARLKGDVRFGGVTVQRPIVNVAPLGPIECIIGTELLSNFSMTVDQKTMRARFSGNPIVPPPPSQYTLGLSVSPDTAGAFRVRTVRPGTAADAAGMRVGDEIVEVEGKRAALETAGPSALRRLAAGGRSIRLRVRRDGRLFDVEVKPQRTIE